MPDAIRLELFEHHGDLLDRARLASVHGDPEAEPAGALEEVAVVGGAEAGRLGAGDVDPDDAAIAPRDGLLGDDLVQPEREVAVEAED